MKRFPSYLLFLTLIALVGCGGSEGSGAPMPGPKPDPRPEASTDVFPSCSLYSENPVAAPGAQFALFFSGRNVAAATSSIDGAGDEPITGNFGSTFSFELTAPTELGVHTVIVTATSEAGLTADCRTAILVSSSSSAQQSSPDFQRQLAGLQRDLSALRAAQLATKQAKDAADRRSAEEEEKRRAAERKVAEEKTARETAEREKQEALAAKAAQEAALARAQAAAAAQPTLVCDASKHLVVVTPSNGDPTCTCDTAKGWTDRNGKCVQKVKALKLTLVTADTKGAEMKHDRQFSCDFGTATCGEANADVLIEICPTENVATGFVFFPDTPDYGPTYDYKSYERYMSADKDCFKIRLDSWNNLWRLDRGHTLTITLTDSGASFSGTKVTDTAEKSLTDLNRDKLLMTNGKKISDLAASEDFQLIRVWTYSDDGWLMENLKVEYQMEKTESYTTTLNLTDLDKSGPWWIEGDGGKNNTYVEYTASEKKMSYKNWGD